nr:hypothetical protein [Allobaculum stercoricanis]
MESATYLSNDETIVCALVSENTGMSLINQLRFLLLRLDDLKCRLRSFSVRLLQVL